MSLVTLLPGLPCLIFVIFFLLSVAAIVQFADNFQPIATATGKQRDPDRYLVESFGYFVNQIYTRQAAANLSAEADRQSNLQEPF